MIARACTNSRGPRRRFGFTLIEVVATIVILAAIGTVASNILLTASDGYLDAAGTAQLHNELSIATDRLAREFRQIDLDNDADDIAPDIDEVTASSMTWHTDSSVALNGTTLQFVEAGGAAATLLTDVTAFSITTHDEDNDPLAATLSGDQCDAIRRIEITVTQTRFGVSETLRARVFLRSTMSGGGTDPS